MASNLQDLPTELKEIKPEMPLTKLLQEFAKAGPTQKAPKNGVINMNSFASGFMSESDSDKDGYFYKTTKPLKQTQKNLKQKKIKTRKDKGRSRKEIINSPAFAQTNSFPLVDAATAQATIQSAGSKPVILVFFSPSKPPY